MTNEMTDHPLNVGRRALLLGGASLMVTGRARPQSNDGTAALAALERRHGGRLGVYALDTQTGHSLGYRADERFKLMSTFKGLLAAMILSDVSTGRESLDASVRYSASDLMPVSPVTQAKVARGRMSVGELCEAIMHRSDNTAATRHHIADLDFDEITSAQLAINREVKQRSVAEPTLPLKEEADSPDLLLR